MKNPVLVRVVNGARYFRDEFDRLPDWHRLTALPLGRLRRLQLASC